MGGSQTRLIQSDVSNESTHKESQLLYRRNGDYRCVRPSARDYTHYFGSFKVYTRLDYFFIVKVDSFKIKDCDILTRDLSDHSPISMSLQVVTKKQNTLWKFNSYIFNDPATVSKIKEEIKAIIIWDTLKAVIRGKLISFTSHLKRTKGQKLADLQTRLNLK